MLAAPAAASSLQTDPRAAGLARMTMVELDGVFAELPPARLAELQGRCRGRVLAVSGLDWVPAGARGLLFGLINHLPIWQGKQFDGEFGANAWLLPNFRIKFGRFLVREADGSDGRPVLRLDYDVTVNPRIVRRVVGELRRMADGSCLVRVQLLVNERVVRIAYEQLV